MRPIDANLLADICKEIAKNEWNKKAAPVSWSDAYEGFIDTIEEMPTVESDCETCKNKRFCQYNHGRHDITRINCPLWRAKG